LSIFQALNPPDYKDWPDDPWLSGVVNPWFTEFEQKDEDGTWTTPAGDNETTTSPLTPFHKDTKGTVYDSDGCRFIKDFGYSFEELQDWAPEFMLPGGKFNTPLYCNTIRAMLNTKYGWARPPSPIISALARGLPLSQLPGIHDDVDLRTVPTEERQFDDYAVNVRVDR
jgi:tyrosinase